MRCFLSLSLIALATLSSAPAAAQRGQVPARRYETLPDRGRRHSGFYLRMQPSVSGVAGTLTDPSQTTPFGGFGGGLDVAVGGNVGGNVILFGELTGLVMGLRFDFDDGTALGRSRGEQETVGTSGGIGIGAQGYIMPANVYIAGSLGLAGASFFTDEDDLDETIDSKTGFYLKLSVGKEWWISRRWAMGISGVVSYRRFKVEADGFWVVGDRGGDIDVITIGPAFSVSFG